MLSSHYNLQKAKIFFKLICILAETKEKRYYLLSKIKYMKIFIIILAIISAVHIIAIARQKEWMRRISKVLLMPTLIAAFITGCFANGKSLQGSVLFTVLALIFGWIGDILLIKKNKRYIFKLGIISFLLGHLCYIVTFLFLLGFFSLNAGMINVTSFFLYIPVLIIGGIFVYGLIKPFKEMKPIIVIYMFIIMSMSLWGFEVFFFNPGIPGALVFFGCLLFLISDTLLAYYAFRKIKLFPAVMIMVSYIIAQTEIVLGLLTI